MHKKAITLGLLAVSVAALATSSSAVNIAALAPAAIQGVAGPVQPYPQTASRPVYVQSSAIAQAVARWRSLRQTDILPFPSYASFLTTYRGWPGEAAMRKTAEQRIDDFSSPGEVAAFFRILPPTSAVGHARHAFALASVGRPDEAREAAKRAWRAGVMPRAVEDRLLSQFSASLGPAEHDSRLETLLANGDVVSAQRVLAFASSPRRNIYDARLALQTKAPDAMSKVAVLGTVADADPGLLIDRAKWLRDTSQSLAARELLAKPRILASRPADVEKFYEGLLLMAKGAANDRQWAAAYRIASQIDDAYAPGTDISAQSYGERDEYTSLAWLAGTTALYQLNRPMDALGMFERYAKAARSPQTRAKGFYWAGRAAAQARQTERANSFFGLAAEYPDQFYGQLAMERVGRQVPSPASAVMAVLTPQARAAFAARDIVQATRLLGQQGQREDQSLFIRALSESLDSDESRALANELAQEISRPDLGVWVARSARNDGATVYTRANFPEVPMPPAFSSLWTLSHAIMRQESSFDRTAMSAVGARGMMQLMPGTARETAGKLGLSYDVSRLTDPQYNIMLGSQYFSQLMGSFGNYAPLAVAAYNAGPGNVRRWMRENGDPRMPGVDIVRWVEEIPYFETRNYVQRVLENAVVYDTMNPARARSPSSMRLSYYLGKQRPG